MSFIWEFFKLIEYPLDMSIILSFGLCGIVSAVVSWKAYNSLRKREEVSMVSFLLNPGETVKEVGIMHRACIVEFLGFIIFGISYLLLLFETSERLGYILAYTIAFTSVYFAISLIRVVYRWERRFRKFE